MFGKQSVTVDSILSCNIDTAMSFSDLDGYLDDLDSCAYYLRCLSVGIDVLASLILITICCNKTVTFVMIVQWRRKEGWMDGWMDG